MALLGPLDIFATAARVAVAIATTAKHLRQGE